jgi:hypothetical protein
MLQVYWRRNIKPETDSGIDDAALDRRPGVHCPAAVKILCRTDEAFVAGLAEVAKMFGIEKDACRTNAAFEQDAKDPVWNAMSAIRIVFKLLLTDVIAFARRSIGRAGRGLM